MSDAGTPGAFNDDFLLWSLGWLVALVVSIYYNNWLSLKKIKSIFRKEYEGVLSRRQAIELLDIYVEDLRRELNRVIDNICDHRVPKMVGDEGGDEGGDMTRMRLSNSIKRNFFKTQKFVSKRYCRFRIASGKSFFELIRGAKQDGSLSSVDDVVDLIIKYYEAGGERGDNSALKQAISGIMNDSVNEGRKLIKKDINTIYE